MGSVTEEVCEANPYKRKGKKREKGREEEGRREGEGMREREVEVVEKLQ